MDGRTYNLNAICEDKPLALQSNAVQSLFEVRQEISRLLFLWT
jgi:hypothetical protein